MSIQLGRWNFDEQPIDKENLASAIERSKDFGPDSSSAYIRGSVGMVFRAFNTTKEAWNESQPIATSAGLVLMWDGRLDNREDLIRSLTMGSMDTYSDAQIVLTAYERWGTNCLVKLLGDWALSIWDPSEKALLLAKDFVGARQLYYHLEPRRVTWSTVLDPLVLSGGRFEISEDWIAGFLSTYPNTELTPFTGVAAVTAGTFTRITCNATLTRAYWDLNSSAIRYARDIEYEEHFRVLFAGAVRRRLRSSHPILAELSGGMDSSSIVCMADQLVERGDHATPRLDTVSYFDDEEPNWDERPFVELVEQKRGRIGYHINMAKTEGYLVNPTGDTFLPLPGPDRLSCEFEKELQQCLKSSDARVLLSGVGGDEFLGGVPNHAIELQDLFVEMRWGTMALQLARWSMQKRRPCLHLLFEALEEFLPQPLRRLYKKLEIPPWLTSGFIERQLAAFWADSTRTDLTGSLPSSQSCRHTLNHLRRQLHCSALLTHANCRISYPYLDRDLIEFLSSVPREQLVRPGQRRSLMRRALSGITPEGILQRKRKAYVARRPLRLIETAWPQINQLLEMSSTAKYGWVDARTLRENLDAAKHGHSDYSHQAHRLLKTELWIRRLASQNVLFEVDPSEPKWRSDSQQTRAHSIRTKSKDFALWGLNASESERKEERICHTANQ